MKKTIIALGVLFSSAAFAQANYVELKNDTLVIPSLNLTVDQVEDLHVYDANGVEVGDVEDVLGTDATAATAVSVDAEKYLGVKSEDVVFTLEELRLEGGRLVTTLSKDEINKLPRHRD